MKKVLLFLLPLLFAIASAQGVVAADDQSQPTVNPEWFFGSPHHYPHLPPHYFLPPHFGHGFPPFVFPFPSNDPNPLPSPTQPPSSPSTPLNNDEKTPFLFPFHPIPFPAFHHPVFPPHFFLPPFPFPFPFPSPSSNSSNPFPFPFPFPSQPPSSPSAPSDSDNGEFLFPLPYGSLSTVKDGHMTCFLAVHDRSMGSCLNDFHSFLMTHEVSVSPGCCSALSNIQESCPVKNPFLDNIVSNNCAASPPSN